MKFPGSRCLLVCSLVFLRPLAAGAEGIPIAVAPVMVKMDTATEYSAVDVSNRGDRATGIEVEVVRVRWVDGREHYEPTSDFVVSPPTFLLAGQKSRLIRFRYTGARQETEGFFRLFIRQLPQAQTAVNQINMVFNLGVPVFVAPATSRPELEAASTGGDAAELKNTGNVTLTLSQLEGAACTEGPHKLLARLAPGQTLKVKATSLQCATNVQTDRGPMALTRR